jgi:hypothetical protein
VDGRDKPGHDDEAGRNLPSQGSMDVFMQLQVAKSRYDYLEREASATGAAMFETSERYGVAVDAETGTKLRVASTSEYETKTLYVELADGRKVQTAIGIESGPSMALIAEATIYDILLGLIELNRLAKLRNGSRQENTEFVRYILSGLAVIHRRWTLSPQGRFFTNRQAFRGRDLKALLAYDVPDEDDIFRLSETLTL